VVISLDKYRKTRKIQASIEIPIGERVAIARKNQGMTQEALGTRIGYSQSTISRMECGEIEIHPQDIAAIAQALGTPELLESFCSSCPVCRAAAKLNARPKYTA
jgi:transcriptional regulator with XRE-family HTH domain